MESHYICHSETGLVVGDDRSDEDVFRYRGTRCFYFLLLTSNFIQYTISINANLWISKLPSATHIPDI